jgi:hypothetical protein
MARRAAQPRLDDPPRPREKNATSCCVPSCTEEATATCGWLMHEKHPETGERIYTGEKCGLKLCPKHANLAGKRKTPLCAWHHKKATEDGLV